jgi:hypothetical protein
MAKSWPCHSMSGTVGSFIVVVSSQAESYKMGSDEGMETVHQEYLGRWRREFEPLPPPILKRKEVSDEKTG